MARLGFLWPVVESIPNRSVIGLEVDVVLLHREVAVATRVRAKIEKQMSQSKSFKGR